MGNIYNNIHETFTRTTFVWEKNIYDNIHEKKHLREPLRLTITFTSNLYDNIHEKKHLR
jgi:hypothetical protein